MDTFIIYDLALAEHEVRVARIEATEWWYGARAPRRSPRAVLAAALVALALRLAPELRAAAAVSARA